MTGIYIHIPFCAKKCPYCDFYSVNYQKTLVKNYVQAIIRNIQFQEISDEVDSIYFGGGTPSLLTIQQISEILETCDKYFHLVQPEITLECNPSGNRKIYLSQLKKAGVNRLSVGVQSFSPKELAILGRTHSPEQSKTFIIQAKEAGFDNISCDIMLALPEQTETILAETLENLTLLPIQHISAYLLQLEENTPFSTNAEILSRLPDDDSAADRYLQAVHTLERKGFFQYEISSFAKAGFQSRHNLKYWQCVPYFGIGAGAHSLMNGKRFFCPKDVNAFCTDNTQKKILLEENACSREEQFMLAFRTTDGVPEEWLSISAREKLPLLEKNGYLKRKPNRRICFTPEGFMVSNALISLLSLP